MSTEKARPDMVAGFLIDGERSRVALIRKGKPAWMAGKLNAIGGKMESGETPLEAMKREFKEETGATVEDWRHFCTLVFRGARVHFFVSFEPGHKLKCMEVEPVGWYELSWLHGLSKEDMVPNLRWLLPMAMDEDEVMAAVQDPS